jgi:hypothetical protein
MNSSDARLARILMDRNVEEASRSAYPQHRAGSVEKAPLGWQAVLAQLGTWLVALGERLAQYAPVQPSL